MNDWQKVAFHVLGVNLTQKKWAATATKNLAIALLKIALLVAVFIAVAFFFGQGWAFGFLGLAFVYGYYKSTAAG